MVLICNSLDYNQIFFQNLVIFNIWTGNWPFLSKLQPEIDKVCKFQKVPIIWGTADDGRLIFLCSFPIRWPKNVIYNFFQVSFVGIFWCRKHGLWCKLGQSTWFQVNYCQLILNEPVHNAFSIYAREAAYKIFASQEWSMDPENQYLRRNSLKRAGCLLAKIGPVIKI